MYCIIFKSLFTIINISAEDAIIEEDDEEEEYGSDDDDEKYLRSGLLQAPKGNSPYAFYCLSLFS